MKQQIVYFPEPGKANTDEVLKLAAQKARELGIKHIVVATTTGETALRAAETMKEPKRFFNSQTKDQDVKIIGVTLHAGTWEKYGSPHPDKVKRAEEMGVTFLTCTHALMGNLSTSIMNKFGGISWSDLIAHTYYTFSQGTKVAVEIAVMAADAALIPTDKEVIAIAGSDTGADTALVIQPAYSTDFFSLKVREIIAKPR